MSKEFDAHKCRRCSATMVLIVCINPAGKEAGLEAYECPKCRATRVVDVPAKRTKLMPARSLNR